MTNVRPLSHQYPWLAHMWRKVEGRYRRLTRSGYPFTDGDFTVIGPEAFYLTSDPSVICYAGENYRSDRAPRASGISTPRGAGKAFRAEHEKMLRSASRWGQLTVPLAPVVRDLIANTRKANAILASSRGFDRAFADIQACFATSEKAIRAIPDSLGFRELALNEGEYRYLEDGRFDAHPTELRFRPGVSCNAEHPQLIGMECTRQPDHNTYHLNNEAPAGKRAWELRA